MIVVDNECFVFECSLKTCTLVCLIVYLIVSVQRFGNGLKKFGEYRFRTSFILELRHVLWSIFLGLAIRGIIVDDDASYLVLCLGIHAIDLTEIIIDYIGFAFTRMVVIPSFGHSNKRYYNRDYMWGLVVFPFLILVFSISWTVVYSYYRQSDKLRHWQYSVVAETDDLYLSEYSSLF